MSDWIINNAGQTEVITLDDDVGIPYIVRIESGHHNPNTIANFTCLSYTMNKEPNFAMTTTLSGVTFLRYLGKQPKNLVVHGLFFDPVGEAGDTYSEVKEFRDYYLIRDPFADSASIFSSPRTVDKITIGDATKTEYTNVLLTGGGIKSEVGRGDFPLFYTEFQFLI